MSAREWLDAAHLRAVMSLATGEDVVTLAAALRAVLELHVVDEWEDGYGNSEDECRVCRNKDDEPAPYPCPTVRVITAALDPTAVREQTGEAR